MSGSSRLMFGYCTMQDGVRADAGAADGAADGGRLPGVRQGLSTDGDGGGGHDAPLVRRPRHPRGDPRRIGERKTHALIRRFYLGYVIKFVASQSGMEQLENLVKLMEELSELRDQNCMLKRKVRVLEDLKQGRQQQPPPPPPPRPEAHKDRS